MKVSGTAIISQHVLQGWRQVLLYKRTETAEQLMCTAQLVQALEREECSLGLDSPLWSSLLDFGTGFMSTWRQYTNERELERINSRITSVATGLDGNIIKVSNDLAHFQDEQTSINLSMNRQSWKLHDQMKSLKKI